MPLSIRRTYLRLETEQLRRVGVAAAALYAAAVADVADRRHHHTLYSRQFAASALLLAVHSYAIWAVFGWYRAGPFISVNPDGVYYRANGPRVHLLGWSDIANGDRKPFIYAWYRPIPANLPPKVRTALATITLNRKDVEAFQAAIFDGLQRYQSIVCG